MSSRGGGTSRFPNNRQQYRGEQNNNRSLRDFTHGGFRQQNEKDNREDDGIEII
jgi:hypothetical protein